MNKILRTCHFYIGQRCTIKVLHSAVGIVSDESEVTLSPTVISWLKNGFVQVTLHLRHRDSLTESEARQVYEAVTGELWTKDYECIRWLGFDDDLGFADQYGWICGCPEGWLKLIELGIDLFGLIKDGFAKDIEFLTTN